MSARKQQGQAHWETLRLCTFRTGYAIEAGLYVGAEHRGGWYSDDQLLAELYMRFEPSGSGIVEAIADAGPVLCPLTERDMEQKFRETMTRHRYGREYHAWMEG